MKIVYIAGPFRGHDAWEIAANVRRAEELSFEVAKLGAMPLCPHKNTENMHGALPDEFFLEGTLELMHRCDAVVFTLDYQRSAGALAEEAEAKRLGLPCFYSVKGLDTWLCEIDLARAEGRPCPRCGAALSVGGACSRRAEGCQGGWGG